MATVKCLKAAAVQLQSGATFEENAMFSLPFTSEEMNQSFDTIEDEAIVGVAFKNVPVQGNRHVGGSIGMQLDAISIEPILEAAFGTNSYVEECFFTLTTPITDPSAGDTYEDTDDNTFTFLRKSGAYYVFSCDDSVVPTLTTGNLDRITGSGDNPLAFTDRSILTNNYQGIFTCNGTTNTKKLSVATLDSVNCYQYANVYMKSLSIKGSSGGKFTVDIELIGVTAESRQVVSSYPAAPTEIGTFFVFNHAGGSGYFRVGDQTDALAAGDNVLIDDFEISMDCGFDEQFASSQTTLTPIFGMAPPQFTGSFKVARHEDNTFLDFRDNFTSLQAALYLYLDATHTILIEIPNFKIDANVSDDDLPQQSITMMIGRNGLGTSYANANMAFTSPVRITVVNS